MGPIFLGRNHSQIYLMTNLIMEEYFIDRLAKLHNIPAECDSTCVTVVGDYNDI